MRAALLPALLLCASPARADEDPASLVAVRLTRPAELERGRAVVLSLAVAPASGLRLLEDAPLTVELTGAALTPVRRTLHRRDAVDPRAEAPRFELEVRADRSGAPSLTARLTAWVCRGARCRPVELTSPLPLVVADARAPRPRAEP